MDDTDVEKVEIEPEVFASEAAVDERKFLRRARRLASRFPFVRHAVAMFHAVSDDGTPLRAKGVIFAALAYFMLPTDLVPDFIAGMGFTDDAAVMIAALKTISTHLKPHHYAKADETLGTPAP